MRKKVKYSYEFKLSLIELVIKEKHSINYVSSKAGIHNSVISKWIMLYKRYGVSGLLPQKTRTYSIDFKQKVLISKVLGLQIPNFLNPRNVSSSFSNASVGSFLFQ